MLELEKLELILRRMVATDRVIEVEVEGKKIPVKVNAVLQELINEIKAWNEEHYRGLHAAAKANRDRA